MTVPLKAVHPAATPVLIFAESGTSFGPREAISTRVTRHGAFKAAPVEYPEDNGPGGGSRWTVLALRAKEQWTRYRSRRYP